jgi:hypothetical protein
MAGTNPNGANQYQLDPRQKLCWDYYINPNSETFANATQSAIKAGYTQGYSDEVSSSDWFCLKLWELNSVNKSVKVFQDVFESSHIDVDTGKIDSAVLRIKADIAKFLASTKGKDDGYSTRQELTGANGDALKLIVDDTERTTDTK